MPGTLEPMVVSRLSDTTHEDQANRVEAFIWQALDDQQHESLQVLPTHISYTVEPTDATHIHLTSPQNFRLLNSYNAFTSNRSRFAEIPVAHREAIEDIGNGENYICEIRNRRASNWRKAIKVEVFTRATSETSTLISWYQELRLALNLQKNVDEGWTEDKNERRCMLVDKEIDGTLSQSEELELDTLQSEMLAFRRKIAPLPLEELREEHQELLNKVSSELT